MDFLQRIFSLPRNQKRLVSLTIDSVFLICAFWGALLVRLDDISVLSNSTFWSVILVVMPISLVAFAKLGLYRAVLRYMGLQALVAILVGITVSTISLVLVSFYAEANIPRTVPLIYAAFSLVFIGGSRTIVRSIVGSGMKRSGEAVIIYGAGVSGRQLLTSLVQSHEYYPFAFVDDDVCLHGTVIQGVHVHSPSIIRKLIKQKSATKVLLAMPSASRAKRQEILTRLEPLAIQILTIPAMADLVNGTKLYSDIKEVEIDDLLGRDAVNPREDLLSANIKDKVVMVTGAGGSIGSELCRQILKQSPRKLVLFELSEFALYAIDRELNATAKELGLDVRILPIMGSVQRENRVQAVMQSFGVQTVYHAAAYKHVPLVEHNVVEGVRNNVFGTLYTARAAIAAKVEKFVLVSTDKAVRPTNVMGTTKRMAELVLQALSREQNKTRFCMVRFGNVLGSSGSVVPLFRTQIANGGPVTVTHPEITRFFMTIPEASQLVIQAGAMGKGGDVFVLDMGKSVKIVDLAEKMIRLSGYEVRSDKNPEGDISIEFSGLRPGEKLYEELLIGDDVTGTEHERIMTANELYLTWADYSVILDRLDLACHEFNHEAIRDILLKTPTGFAPTDGICDLVYQQKAKNLAAAKKVISFAS
ncbi:polysaccharide biosynthesis protein [Shewanella psychromarinicola]|uniref:Polysaccharide biosynthesis protein n=1 Tax=Shewanella psychromarinicola TaxID=2487742 RepID=A0A3N4EF11_9GAMM|nr:nucleoside-diphosphate sugar epimerase/dehydratase [Shewanella psychromarinicola]AZG35365.1 polysaccharide biosynthesis protein [Shewanella psychromarinicola]MCL1083602.1 polysaccharide biosynthesis protein [Shewanella psychromarinicola]RPA32830.1 polysaccharide biosynthesis protein [Shewanella psychromarinicola]